MVLNYANLGLLAPNRVHISLWAIDYKTYTNDYRMYTVETSVSDRNGAGHDIWEADTFRNPTAGILPSQNPSRIDAGRVLYYT